MVWSTRKQSPIGLDLGAHSFKAVQLGANGEVTSALSLPRRSPGVAIAVDEMIRLGAVLQRRGFVGSEVVVSVPSEDLLTSVLELPARTPGMPMEQLAFAEFGRVHRLDVDALSVSAWELPATARASKATYMLAVGAKSEQLEAHVDLIEAGGLNVIAIDDPHSAGARGCLRGTTSQTGLIAVVDLGWTCSTLAIIKGPVVVYTRDLSDGGLADAFRDAEETLAVRPEEIRHALWHHGFAANSDDADADVLNLLGAHLGRMLKEIEQAIGYATHQYPDAVLNRVLITGGGALIPGIADRFAHALGLPVGIGSGDPSPTAELITALGLALKPEVAR